MQHLSGVLVLNKEEIESVINMDDAIEAVEDGFEAYNSGKAVTPFPIALQVPDHSGDIHIKPGYVKGYDTYTVKIGSGFYENPQAGLPVSHSMPLLFDSRTGHFSASRSTDATPQRQPFFSKCLTKPGLAFVTRDRRGIMIRGYRLNGDPHESAAQTSPRAMVTSPWGAFA